MEDNYGFLGNPGEAAATMSLHALLRVPCTVPDPH